MAVKEFNYDKGISLHLCKKKVIVFLLFKNFIDKLKIHNFT